MDYLPLAIKLGWFGLLVGGFVFALFSADALHFAYKAIRDRYHRYRWRREKRFRRDMFRMYPTRNASDKIDS